MERLGKLLGLLGSDERAGCVGDVGMLCFLFLRLCLLEPQETVANAARSKSGSIKKVPGWMPTPCSTATVVKEIVKSKQTVRVGVSFEGTHA